MTKKILLTGPESSGKTTLAEQLAQHFKSSWQPEYAREYLSGLDRPYTMTDLTTILFEQNQKQAEILSANPPLLFCDTGPEVIYIWSQVKYGTVTAEIEQQLAQQEYDLRLLCYPDLDWEADPLREAPEAENRLELWQKYVELHQKQGWLYTTIRGQWEERLAQAVTAVNAIFV